MAGSNEKAPAPRRWLRWVLGCSTVLALLCCGVPAGLFEFVRRQNLAVDKAVDGHWVDRIFREAFADGDLPAAFEGADPDLRKAHDRPEFLAFFADWPWLPPPAGVTLKKQLVVFFNERTHHKFVLNDGAEGPEVTEVIFFCVEIKGKLILLGISPGLDGGVPDALKEAFENPEAHRVPRRRFRDIFD